MTLVPLRRGEDRETKEDRRKTEPEVEEAQSRCKECWDYQGPLRWMRPEGSSRACELPGWARWLSLEGLRMTQAKGRGFCAVPLPRLQPSLVLLHPTRQGGLISAPRVSHRQPGLWPVHAPPGTAVPNTTNWVSKQGSIVSQLRRPEAKVKVSAEPHSLCPEAQGEAPLHVFHPLQAFLGCGCKGPFPNEVMS